MSAPVERLIGKTQYNPVTGMIRVEVPYTDYATLIRRGYHRAEVVLLDDRPISDKQRKACYALMGEIAEFMGEDREEVKELMKFEFMTSELCDTGERLFSMADAPMSLIAAYQKFLVRFIIRHDIPTKKSLLSYVDDIDDYVYSCLINRKCVCCGLKADLHHVDAVGMGRDRTEIIHEGMKALPLCRVHHTECHTMGNKDFLTRYHINDGIELDRTLCRLYGLKAKGGKKSE